MRRGLHASKDSPPTTLLRPRADSLSLWEEVNNVKWFVEKPMILFLNVRARGAPRTPPHAISN